MILQALYGLAQNEDLMKYPDFEYKPVAWMVRVSRDGRLLGIQDTRQVPSEQTLKKKPKAVPQMRQVPRQPTGRSGIKAPSCFFVDNAKYVFGLATKGKSFAAEEGREKAGWFRDQVAACAESTKDAGAQAVLLFLDDVAVGRQQVSLPEGCASNDLFAFVYDPDIDQLVHLRPKVVEYWKRQRAFPKDSSVTEVHCLVSGQLTVATELFPLIEGIPGANPSRIGLVSFNKNAFESYGWKGNENAPISRDAAEACATALNRLLHPAYPDPHQPGQTLPSRHLRLSADTVVCFWTADKSGDDFCSVFSGLLEANPEVVKELYRSVWRGKSPEIKEPSVFYALTLTGTQGRAVVRDWFESTVGQVAENVAAHFRDLEIVRNTPKPREHDLPPQMPLSLLLQSLAVQGDRESIPAPLIAEMVEAALHGTPYPFSVLQRVLERTRAEIGRTDWPDLNRRDARVALIKAVLNRRRRFYKTSHYEEVKPDMDPNNTSQGYLLGSLMAVLERTQQEAMGDLNASVVDRFFSGASATPKAVFVRLMKNARHHVRKAKDDPQKGGTVFRLDRLIDELADRFDPKRNGFPAHLDLEQQGLFVLGYHQMRKWLWMNREERTDWEKAHPDAPRAYVWNAAKQNVVN